MKRSAIQILVLIVALLVISPFVTRAQQVITLEPAKPAAPPLQPGDVLPDKLAGAKATGAVRQIGKDNLAELVGNEAAVYQEYKVAAAASRQYGATRVDVFQTEKPFAAFGLFSFYALDVTGKTTAKEVASSSAAIAGGLAFWKNNYFVRVSDAGAKGLAAAVAAKIPAGSQDTERPTLINNLPQEALVGRSARYFLGAQSLNAHFAGANELFLFDGEAEAAIAEYRDGKQTPNSTTPLKLVVVEYHTPQFATQAMAQAESVLAALPEADRERLLIKRVGNFIVGVTGFQDRQVAEQLAGKVEYPYVVKWLQNPAIPTDDPFRIEKAAAMLVSTISIIGLTGGVVLVMGILVGSLIFVRRRKQQREVFSDAGGMLRLQLDPMEDSLLGLPSARAEE